MSDASRKATLEIMAKQKLENYGTPLVNLGTSADGFAPKFGFKKGTSQPFKMYGRGHKCFCGASESQMWGVLHSTQCDNDGLSTTEERMRALSDEGPHWVWCEACISVGNYDAFERQDEKHVNKGNRMMRLSLVQHFECERMGIEQNRLRRVAPNHVVFLGRIHVKRSMHFAVWDTKDPSGTVKIAHSHIELWNSAHDLAGKILDSLPDEALADLDGSI